MNTTWAIFGDIHSRSVALYKALKDSENCNRIFLGDILDGRYLKEVSAAFKTQADLNTLTLLEQYNCFNKDCIFLIGNHDKALCTEETNSKLSLNTIARLKNHPLFIKYKQKLSNSKAYYSFFNSAIKYELAHAYPFETAIEKEQIFGFKIDGKRHKWFEHNFLTDSFKISGHYHQILLEENFCVLDGDNSIDACLPVLFINPDNTKQIKKYSDNPV